VSIASATAGAATDTMYQTFDDNETTEWKSDGKLANAWIKYDFARPAVVSEVTIKFANWRTRSYPIRITIDDKVAYVGETPRSLGYVTFTFPPITGHSLKIELTGAPRNIDAFGQIIEVTGQKDLPAADKDEKGTLSIVEIEIYGPAQLGARASSRAFGHNANAFELSKVPLPADEDVRAPRINRVLFD
jgi:hypothetical protein